MIRRPSWVNRGADARTVPSTITSAVWLSAGRSTASSVVPKAAEARTEANKASCFIIAGNLAPLVVARDHGPPSSLRTVTYRLPPHRRRPYRALQLALRPQAQRHLRF